jgi:hypothetical protein
LTTTVNGVVYFVERGEYIKIGFTRNLDVRLRALRSGQVRMPDGMTIGPLTLLASVKGSGAQERAIHRQFADLRVNGEWFVKDRRLLDFVAKVRSGEEMLPAANSALATHAFVRVRRGPPKVYRKFVKRGAKVYRYWAVMVPLNGRRKTLLAKTRAEVVALRDGLLKQGVDNSG